MKHDSTLKDRDSNISTLNRVPTSNRCFIAKEFEESSEAGTQMTGGTPGAPAGDVIKWHTMNWDAAWRHVRRLQMRNQTQQPTFLKPTLTDVSTILPKNGC